MAIWSPDCLPNSDDTSASPTLVDHTGAPRSLPMYLAMMWLPVVASLVVGTSTPTLVASMLATVAIAVVAGACLGDQTRRVMAQVVAVLRRPVPRTPARPDATMTRRRRTATPLRELILAARVGDPRA